MQSIGFHFSAAAGVAELFGGQRHCAAGLLNRERSLRRRWSLPPTAAARSSAFTHSIGAGSRAAARSLAAVEADLVGRDEGRDAVLAGDVC